ncbi:THO complex subunit 6 homolog [Haliotis cracherodii]|uniref:THO complex subunit 6 homolog n=1 Tax=Haliotis cracherodii TaxID=6455 RepID=UPI0039EA6CFF
MYGGRNQNVNNSMPTEDRGLSVRQFLHTTVFSQCFSPCGKYLVAANNYGQIAVFNLSSSLSPDAVDTSYSPVFTFRASEDGAVYCLASTSTLLISAGEGDICAWRWADILNKAPKIIWSFSLPKKGVFTNPEVNSIVMDQQETRQKLVAGCGDNNVHVWDMESGNLEQTLGGHEDYVHRVCLKNEGRECLSASEDGTVRMWDLRSPGESVHILEPSKHEMCSRPEMGRWLGCVTLDSGEDWMVCGGGPKLAMWHMRSLQPTTTFNTPGVCQTFARFHDDTLISGGTEPMVNHWFLNGELKQGVPCTPTSVFNVNINLNSDKYKVLSVGGSSAMIDVCTNFGYKAFSLKFKTS